MNGGDEIPVVLFKILKVDAAKMLHSKKLLSHESCQILCDSMDCSLPGSSVHGFLQARILEWVAVSFSRGSS